MAATMLGSDYVIHSQIFAGLFMEAQFKFYGYVFDVYVIICDGASSSLHARLIGSAIENIFGQIKHATSGHLSHVYRM